MTCSSKASDEQIAFLASCINKTRSVRDAHESLGLYSQTNEQRKDPDFYKAEANEFYSKAKQIAMTLAASSEGGLEQLQTDLAKPILLSAQLDELGDEYGQAIWGRGHRGQTKPLREQSSIFEDFDWNIEKDRAT